MRKQKQLGTKLKWRLHFNICQHVIVRCVVRSTRQLVVSFQWVQVLRLVRRMTMVSIRSLSCHSNTYHLPSVQYIISGCDSRIEQLLLGS